MGALGWRWFNGRYLGFFRRDDLLDDNELMSSLSFFDESLPLKKKDLGFEEYDCDPPLAKGPELNELEAPIVTDPMTVSSTGKVWVRNHTILFHKAKK